MIVVHLNPSINVLIKGLELKTPKRYAAILLNNQRNRATATKIRNLTSSNDNIFTIEAINYEDNATRDRKGVIR